MSPASLLPCPSSPRAEAPSRWSSRVRMQAPMQRSTSPVCARAIDSAPESVSLFGRIRVTAVAATSHAWAQRRSATSARAQRRAAPGSRNAALRAWTSRAIHATAGPAMSVARATNNASKEDAGAPPDEARVARRAPTSRPIPRAAARAGLVAVDRLRSAAREPAARRAVPGSSPAVNPVSTSARASSTAVHAGTSVREAAHASRERASAPRGYSPARGCART